MHICNDCLQRCSGKKRNNLDSQIFHDLNKALKKIIESYVRK